MTIMGQRVCVRVEAGVYASVNMCRFTPDFDFTYVVTGDYSSCQRLLVETLKKTPQFEIHVYKILFLDRTIRVFDDCSLMDIIARNREKMR